MRLSIRRKRQQQTEEYRQMQIVQDAVDDVLDNISILDNISSKEELNEAMPKLLAFLGKYSLSDRSYMFTWTEEDRSVMKMTHEWCAEKVEPTIDKMQNVRIEDMPNWAPRLRAGEAIVSADWEEERRQTPEEFELFDGQDIHSLIVIPILSNKKLNGYIGFDNPEQSKTALSLRLLKAVGGHIGGLKENLLMMEEQEQQKVKLENALAESTLNSEIIGSISKIYWLIYRMDLVRGTYDEVSSGQEMHRLTGKRGTIADVFKNVRETIVDEEHQELMREFLDTSTLALRLKDTESIAAEYRAANGSWHLGRFIVKKRDKNGVVTNVLYVVRKIDKQKQLEIEYRQRLLETADEARRANIAKTDFLRRMSHDIRTPINGIQGMIEIAEHYADDKDKQKECREKVREATGFLMEIVNSVLDMNKLESGAIELEHEPFDILKVLEETNSITKMSAQMKGLTVNFNHSTVVHRHVIGSPVHLKQILQNIAGNAVKYNREGGEIRLSCEELKGEERQAVYCFRCTDTGRGMSEEFIKHAFEPFAQEEQSARTAYMGTGLGLAIAKQLTEMMNGKIEVKSVVNVGTTFTITIPFDLHVSYEEEERKEEVTGTELAGKKVLLVEDNDLNMEIAEFLLEKAGMEVTKAQNGEIAVEIFKISEEGYFDVILMDVMMPVMDGLTATKKIRELERKDAKVIPIFAMTANTFASDRKNCRDAGMNGYIPKPVSIQTITDTLNGDVNKL